MSSFLNRLLGREKDPREEWRPLWHTLVGVAREPHWYASRGVADTIDGRFDMISMLTALFVLRLEQDPEGIPPAARLTELFVEDMEGQMREAGIGDPTVGKKLGKMMATLGGRVGTLRESLAKSDDDALAQVVVRNMHLSDEEAGPTAVAEGLRQAYARLTETSFDQLRRGVVSA